MSITVLAAGTEDVNLGNVSHPLPESEGHWPRSQGGTRQVGGQAGSRAHTGLRCPTRGRGCGQGLSPGVQPVSLSHHTQKGTLVAGRPGGVQRWRGSGGSEEERVGPAAQGTFSGASGLPTGPQPPGVAGWGPCSLITPAGGARPQGPSLHPATWASSCLRVTAEGPPPTSLASQDGPPRVPGSAPRVPQTHRASG